MSRSRRFAGVIAFVLLWSLVLVVPSLRLLWQSQMGDISLGKNSVLDSIISAGVTSDWNEVKARYPHDPRVIVVADLPSDNLKQLPFYDTLIAQYPDATWLLTARMRASSLGHLIPNAEVGEFMPRPMSPPVSPPGMVPSAIKDNPPWLSPTELHQGLRMAEVGIQHDPQNAFYDWMRAAFYFSLHQPDDAVAALQAGAKKTRFDDGVLQQAQINDAVLYLRGHPMWESRLAVSAGMLLPHYALLRNVTRAALWQAILARRAGDERRALTIFDAVQRGGALMRHDTSIAIGALVAEAIERMAWSTAAHGIQTNNSNRPAAYSTYQEAQKRTLLNVQQFAAQARRTGQESMGQFALQEASEFDGHSVAGRATNYTDFSMLIGDARFFFAAWWVGKLLLLCTAAALCVWASESVCLVWGRAPHGADDITRTDVIACAIFCLPALAFAAAAVMTAGAGNWMAYMGYDYSDDGSGTYSPDYSHATATLVVSWLPMLLTLAYAVVASLWRTRKTRALAPKRPLLPRLLKGVLMTVGGVIGICLLLGIVSILSLPLPSFTLTQWQPLSLLLCVPLVFLVRWWVLHNTVRLPPLRIGVHTLYALEWHRRAVGILVLLFSFGYLLSSLTALPARRRADAAFDRYILRGEVALARESLTQYPPTASEIR